MNKFKINDRVVKNDAAREDRGTVILCNDNSPLIAVKWDVGTTSVIPADELIPQSVIEAEFEMARSVIADKLNQAAALLKEADDLATSHGRDLRDLYTEHSPLLNAMESAGWNTSSLYC